MFWRVLLLVILLCCDGSRAEGFVEEVSCSSNALTVMLNRSDPSLIRWMADAQSEPVVYVYGHKERTPCGIALKSSNGLPIYNFTIPYGPTCSVALSDLEPNYQTAETTIAIEDNAVPEASKNMRIHHVFCLYTRRVEALRISDIQTGHSIVASTGGKPKPKVALQFASKDGRPLRAAKFGDTVKLTLALSPDQAYKAILPKKCMFTDREDMKSSDAKKLTFVQSECPVQELSEIVDPVKEMSEEMYQTQFKTFRFGNQTTVYAHCTVQVCLNPNECEKSCFHREINTDVPLQLHSNSTVTVHGSLERFRDHRRRTRRSAQPSEVAISNALTILDDEETSEITGQLYSRATQQNGVGDVPMCHSTPHRVVKSGSLHFVYIMLCLLAVGFLLCALLALVLGRKLKIKTKELETQTLSGGSLYFSRQPQPSGSYLGGHRPLQEWAAQSGAYTGPAATVHDHRSSMRSISEVTVPQRMAWS